MALSDNYALAFLSDRLCVQSVTIDQRRNDELSGTGDGRIWAAQLASPLWSVSVSLHNQHAAKAREISSKIWALDGTRRTFSFADPTYRPASGAKSALGVTVASVSTERTSIGLAGLPAGYAVNWGDYLSVAWGSGRLYFGSFAENNVANGSGALVQTAVTPFLPHGIAVGAVVELITPRMRVIVPPGGYSPFSFHHSGRWGQGAVLNMVQKL